MSRRVRASLVLAFVTALSACAPGGNEAGSPAGGGSSNSAAKPSSAPSVTVAPITASLTATGPHGASLSLKAPPKRIVCLVGVCDDIAAALGIQPAATSHPLIAKLAPLGGRTVTALPGSFGAEDPAAIAAVKPDLVIGMKGSHDAIAPALAKSAPVLLVDTRTDEDAIGYLRMIATLTGRTDEAVREEKAYRTALADAQAAARTSGVQGTRVLAMWGNADGFGVMPAGSEPVGSMLAKVANYPFGALGDDMARAGSYSMEQILEKDPHVVFMSSMTFSPTDKTATESMATNPLWKQVTAVKKGHVHEVDKNLWAMCRGTRCLTQVLKDAVPQIEKAAR